MQPATITARHVANQEGWYRFPLEQVGRNVPPSTRLVLRPGWWEITIEAPPEFLVTMDRIDGGSSTDFVIRAGETLTWRGQFTSPTPTIGVRGTPGTEGIGSEIWVVARPI